MGAKGIVLLIAPVCSVSVSRQVEGGGRESVSIGSDTTDSHSSYKFYLVFVNQCFFICCILIGPFPEIVNSICFVCYHFH